MSKRWNEQTGPKEAKRLRETGEWARGYKGNGKLRPKMLSNQVGDLCYVKRSMPARQLHRICRGVLTYTLKPEKHWIIGQLDNAEGPAPVLLREDDKIITGCGSRYFNPKHVRQKPILAEQVACHTIDRPIPRTGPKYRWERRKIRGWDTKVLHCETGPAVVWPETELELYFLNNVEVPGWLAMTPGELLNPRRMLELGNAQVRAEFIRKVGMERIWTKMANVIDQWEEYELGLIRLDKDLNGVFLKMRNPSVPEVWHIEGVGPECRTVEQALHWRKPEAMQAIPMRVDGEEWYQQGDICIWPEEAKSLKPFPSKLT